MKPELGWDGTVIVALAGILVGAALIAFFGVGLGLFARVFCWASRLCS